MRSVLFLSSMLVLAGCETNTNPTTGVTTTTVSPWANLAVGDFFTVAQGAAKAAIANPKYAALATTISSLLTTAQQDFNAWSTNPTAGTAEALALNNALTALTSYMASHNVSAA